MWQLAVSGWAAVSLVVALLPPGAGGPARAVNAVLFLTAGPGCALAGLLGGRVPWAMAASVAVAASLAVLLLSSQLLLILGLWAPWRVAALAALATIVLVVFWIRSCGEVRR